MSTSDGTTPDPGDKPVRAKDALAQTGRRSFPGISSRAFEHPADSAAMAALRKVPGFDIVLRKLMGLLPERGFRYVYLGSAIRVDAAQMAKLNAIYEDCLRILDMPRRPDLFVAQTPIVNAGAIGTDKPFIVLNSATLDLFDDEEIRYIIGHELGHIMADHVLYKTMLRVIVQMSLSVLRGMPMLLFVGVLIALLEWDRKAELTGDRAGLLCLQDPERAYRIEMKMAGGAQADQMSVEAFIQQGRDYEAGEGFVDSAVKLLNLIGRSHPFHVQRVTELKKWVDAGGYQKVLEGDYTRRNEDDEASVMDEVREGARSYREDYARSSDPLARFISDMGQTISSASSTAWDGVKSLFSRVRSSVDEPSMHDDEPDKAKEPKDSD